MSKIDWRKKKKKKKWKLFCLTQWPHSPSFHFFFLLRVDYFGEEIEFLILSNISRIPSVVKSLLPSFLLFTDLCIFCSVQNKHVTNHMVCNFLSFFSLSTRWLLPKHNVFSIAISPHIYFLQKAFFPWRVNPAFLFHSLWKSKNMKECRFSSMIFILSSTHGNIRSLEREGRHF